MNLCIFPYQINLSLHTQKIDSQSSPRRWLYGKLQTTCADSKTVGCFILPLRVGFAPKKTIYCSSWLHGDVNFIESISKLVSFCGYFTSKPSSRKQALCASISLMQSGCSSPLKTTHSSRGFLVSGQQQQMGFPVLMPSFCFFCLFGWLAKNESVVDSEKRPQNHVPCCRLSNRIESNRCEANVRCTPPSLSWMRIRWIVLPVQLVPMVLMVSKLRCPWLL